MATVFINVNDVSRQFDLFADGDLYADGAKIGKIAIDGVSSNYVRLSRYIYDNVLKLNEYDVRFSRLDLFEFEDDELKNEVMDIFRTNFDKRRLRDIVGNSGFQKVTMNDSEKLITIDVWFSLIDAMHGNVSKCNHCSTIGRTDNEDSMVNGHGTYYCAECVPHLCTCVQCGGNVHEENIVYSDGDEICCSYECRDEFDYCDDDCHDNDELYWSSDGTNLPRLTKTLSNRTYGIELETSEFSGEQSPITQKYYSGMYDGSISGTELVSDVLYGDEGINVTRKMLKSIKEENCAAIDGSCGFHLHVGVDDFSTINMVNLFKFGVLNEQLFYNLFPTSRRNNNYCKSLREIARYRNGPRDKHFNGTKSKLYTKNKEGFVTGLVYNNPESKRGFSGTYDTETNMINDTVSYCKRNKYGLDSRYTWLNFVPVLRQETVEVRLHTATLNANKIEQWTRLWVGIIDAIKGGKIKGGKYKSIARIITRLNYSLDVKRKMIKYFNKRIARYNPNDDTICSGWEGYGLAELFNGGTIPEQSGTTAAQGVYVGGRN